MTQVKNQKQSKFEIVLRETASLLRKLPAFLFDGAANRANFLNKAVQGVDQTVAHQGIMHKLTPFFTADQARIYGWFGDLDSKSRALTSQGLRSAMRGFGMTVVACVIR